jgi:hypothetical protein
MNSFQAAGPKTEPTGLVYYWIPGAAPGHRLAAASHKNVTLSSYRTSKNSPKLPRKEDIVFFRKASGRNLKHRCLRIVLQAAPGVIKSQEDVRSTWMKDITGIADQGIVHLAQY